MDRGYWFNACQCGTHIWDRLGRVTSMAVQWLSDIIQRRNCQCSSTTLILQSCQ
jgi:hypothetical protein